MNVNAPKITGGTFTTMTKLTSTNRPRLEIAGPDLVEPISVLPYAEIANVLNSF